VYITHNSLLNLLISLSLYLTNKGSQQMSEEISVSFNFSQEAYFPKHTQSWFSRLRSLPIRSIIQIYHLYQTYHCFMHKYTFTLILETLQKALITDLRKTNFVLTFHTLIINYFNIFSTIEQFIIITIYSARFTARTPERGVLGGQCGCVSPQ